MMVTRAKRLRCQLHGPQHGSVLLVALVFLLVLSRMAQGGLDAALAGVQLVLNYRVHERAVAEAENTIALVDAGLLSAIEHSGMTAGIAALAQHTDHTMAHPDNVVTVSFHIESLWPDIDDWAETMQGQHQCAAMYRITAEANSVLLDSKATLRLERQVCCESRIDCEQGAFVSTSTNLWRS